MPLPSKCLLNGMFIPSRHYSFFMKEKIFCIKNSLGFLKKLLKKLQLSMDEVIDKIICASCLSAIHINAKVRGYFGL